MSDLTLILSVSALDLFVRTLLHLPLENTRSCRLVIVGYDQDMSRIDPVVGSSPHNMLALYHNLVDGDLLGVVSAGRGKSCVQASRDCIGAQTEKKVKIDVHCCKLRSR